MFLSALSSSAQTILRDFPTRLTSKQSCSFCKFVVTNYLALLALTLHQIWVRAVGGCSLSVFYKAREMEVGEQRRRGESKVKWHFATALFTGRWWFTRGETQLHSVGLVSVFISAVEPLRISIFFLNTVYGVLPRDARHVISTQPLFICTCGCMEPIRTIISTTHYI